MARTPFANVGAEAGAIPDLPAVKALAAAWTSLVDDPPWPFLHRARGVVPWMATPEAAAWARSRGEALWGASVDVVTATHDKAFAMRTTPDAVLGDLVTVLEPGAVSAERVADVVARWPAWARARFTVKPRWGTSGRGRVAGVDGTAPIARGSFARGAVVEPWLARTLDLSSLWVIHDDGAVELLGTTEQRLRPAGVYLGCTLTVADAGPPQAGTSWDAAAIAGGRTVVEAAARAGLVGPCGVDAFAWRDADGVERLRPVVELNARFTAGHVAIGLALREGAPPGTRLSFMLDRSPLIARAATTA